MCRMRAAGWEVLTQDRPTKRHLLVFRPFGRILREAFIGQFSLGMHVERA